MLVLILSEDSASHIVKLVCSLSRRKLTENHLKPTGKPAAVYFLKGVAGLAFKLPL